MRNPFSTHLQGDTPEHSVGMGDALAIAKQLARLNSRHWDDATATATLTDQFFGKRCWDVMPGFEEKEWIEQETDGHPTSILIDAETGNFAGLSYTRDAVPADKLVNKYFKLRPKNDG